MSNIRADTTYKKLKKRHGERFARAIRNHHSGLLEIPELDEILAHAGNHAEALLPYLMTLMPKDAENNNPEPVIEDPFVLLARAGYDAFIADDFEKQNSISSYFQKGELLCTFNDRARYQNYYIVHTVKKDVDRIIRQNFNGREKREDAYGTSVISIQILKFGGFISIKNRYNHSVPNPDHTFNSNPDNIIQGLSVALQKYFNVDFYQSAEDLPDGYAMMNGRIFKYHDENNNIYYGDQAWAENGVIHVADKSAGDALFGPFIFDNKTKMLRKVDPHLNDSFADDFNKAYGGNRRLSVQGGHLLLDTHILIKTEESQITELDLPDLKEMSDNCILKAPSLTRFHAPSLTTMGDGCLNYAPLLKTFDAPVLTTMMDGCLYKVYALQTIHIPTLTTMRGSCLHYAPALMTFDAPALTIMGEKCLNNVSMLSDFYAPALQSIGESCLSDAKALRRFDAPALTIMDNFCLYNVPSLTHFDAPVLQRMGDKCLYKAPILISFEAPSLKTMGNCCLHNINALTVFKGPSLTRMGHYCLNIAPSLRTFEAPKLEEMGDDCLFYTISLNPIAPIITQAKMKL